MDTCCLNTKVKDMCVCNGEKVWSLYMLKLNCKSSGGAVVIMNGRSLLKIMKRSCFFFIQKFIRIIPWDSENHVITRQIQLRKDLVGGLYEYFCVRVNICVINKFSSFTLETCC